MSNKRIKQIQNKYSEPRGKSAAKKSTTKAAATKASATKSAAAKASTTKVRTTKAAATRVTATKMAPRKIAEVSELPIEIIETVKPPKRAANSEILRLRW